MYDSVHIYTGVHGYKRNFPTFVNALEAVKMRMPVNSPIAYGC
jgi:hypothetical protein